MTQFGHETWGGLQTQHDINNDDEDVDDDDDGDDDDDDGWWMKMDDGLRHLGDKRWGT